MSPKTLATDLAPKLANYRLARLGLARPVMPINLTLSVTNVCQSRCKTCSIWAIYNKSHGGDPSKYKEELALDEMAKLFKSLGHVYFVNISGGEPYLRSDFPELVDLADRMLKPSVIHVPTNAILPSRIEEMTRDILQRLSHNNSRARLTIKPSFDGIGEMHDQIRGVPGNFEKLMDTVDRLRKLRDSHPNLEVGLGTVISVFNVDKIEEIAAFAHNQGVDSYISEIAEQRSEMYNEENSITPTADDYERAIRIFADMSRKHIAASGKVARATQAFRFVYYDLVVRILREQRQVLPCYGGISNAHISPYGDLWPCCILGYEKSMGNLRDSDYDFRRIWHSDRAAEARRYIAGGNCACPLANQAYSNILCSPITMARAAWNMLIREG